MKKKILISVLAIVMMITCIACFAACNKKNTSDYDAIKEKGYFVCGITLYEPMNYANEDGEMTGFDTEFAQAVAAKMGLKAKFQVIAWDDKFIELNGKSIDCIWNGFTVNEERKGQVDFSKSYLNNTQCVVVKASNLATLNSEDAVAGKKAAAEAGSAGESAAKDLTKDNAKVTAVGAQSNALTEVKSGTVDFAVIDVIMANSMVGKGDYSDLAIATGIQLEPEEYAIGFRKGSDMTEKVNAVIGELIADGTLQTLAEKYGIVNQLVK